MAGIRHFQALQPDIPGSFGNGHILKFAIELSHDLFKNLLKEFGTYILELGGLINALQMDS